MNLDTSSSDAEVMENLRERRPALGRKRARFSLKPNSRSSYLKLIYFLFNLRCPFFFCCKLLVEFNFTSLIFHSQPTVSLGLSLDIDKLKDPEEFFTAFERAESKFAARLLSFSLFLLGNLICNYLYDLSFSLRVCIVL